MAVAVKSPETTSSRATGNWLLLGSVVGVAYLIALLALLFWALPRVWWDWLHLDPNSAVNVILLNLTGLAVGGLLAYAGLRLLGAQSIPGLRAGIFVLFVSLLLVLLLTRWVSTLFEKWVFEDHYITEMMGIGLTIAVAVILAGVALWFCFLRPRSTQSLVAFEEQGWFTTHSYKRSQGQRVRRGTILGILVIFGAGIWSLVTHGALAGTKDWALTVPFTGTVTVTDWKDAGRLPGTGELPTTVDQFTFRDRNDTLKNNYYKITSIGESSFDKDQLVEKARLQEELTRLTGELNREEFASPQAKEVRRVEMMPTYRVPDPAVGTPHHRSITLLPDVRYSVPLVLMALGLWLAWRLVNFPAFADFLIATEAELNKVSWTTRRRLVQDTIVVLTTMLLLTGFLFAVDNLWRTVLSWRPIGVLKIPEGQVQQGPKEQPW